LSWFEPGFAHHQSQDCQGTRPEVPPKLRAIADEVIVLLFAAVPCRFLAFPDLGKYLKFVCKVYQSGR